MKKNFNSIQALKKISLGRKPDEQLIVRILQILEDVALRKSQYDLQILNTIHWTSFQTFKLDSALINGDMKTF